MRHIIIPIIIPFLASTALSQSTGDPSNSFGGDGGDPADRPVEDAVSSFAPSSPNEEVISGDLNSHSSNDYLKFFNQIASKNEVVADLLKGNLTAPEEWTIMAMDKVPAFWPVIVAAIPPGLDFANRGPPNFQDADSHTYTWSFGVPEQELPNACTDFEGVQRADPCTGKVVNRWFNVAGPVEVTLTIKPPSGDEIVIQKTIEVLESFPSDVETRRYEVRDMPDEAWVEFVKAMYKLKSTRIYDHLTQIHAASFAMSVAEGNPTRSTGHGGPAFLPFHRVFVRIMEHCLQHAANDFTLGQPYWDWTLDAEQDGGLSSEIFTNKWYGPGGRLDADGFISSGAFCGVPNDMQETCVASWYIPEAFNIGVNVRRELGRDGALPTKQDLERFMAMETYDAVPYSDKPSENPGFRVVLEGWQLGDFGPGHNGVHQWVGGTMYNVFYAVGDPIFLAHHAMVDKVFTEWQDKQACYEDCYRPQMQDSTITPESAPGAVEDGQGGYHLLGSHIGDIMEPWGIRIFQAFARKDRWTVGNVTYMEPGSKFIRADGKGGGGSSTGSGKPGSASSLGGGILVMMVTLGVLLISL